MFNKTFLTFNNENNIKNLSEKSITQRDEKGTTSFLQLKRCLALSNVLS
jgi:hypothetical protein